MLRTTRAPGQRRARGAETGRPREQWSAVPRVGQPLQGLPPNPMARATARAVDPDSSRRARTRGLMDASHS